MASAYKPGEFEALEAEARPISTSMAQEIASLANRRKGSNGAAAFGLLLAEIVLQTVLVSVLLSIHRSHSKDGEDAIRKAYQQFGEEAVRRWYKKDTLGMGKGEPYGRKDA